jgi:hypothetical protein
LLNWQWHALHEASSSWAEVPAGKRNSKAATETYSATEQEST